MSVAATHDTTSAQWSKRPFIVENVCYMSKKGKLLNVRPIFLGHINLHIHTHTRANTSWRTQWPNPSDRQHSRTAATHGAFARSKQNWKKTEHFMKNALNTHYLIFTTRCWTLEQQSFRSNSMHSTHGISAHSLYTRIYSMCYYNRRAICSV